MLAQPLDVRKRLERGGIFNQMMFPAVAVLEVNAPFILG